MTALEIEKEIQERQVMGLPHRGKLLPGAKYIYVNEAWDRNAEGAPYYVIPELIALHDEERGKSGEPTTLTSVYRTRETQNNLNSKWGKAKLSAHSFGAAFDRRTNGIQHAEFIVERYKAAAKRLGLPVPRFGMRKYQGIFIHVDIVFLHFKEFGGPFDYPSDSEPIRINWRPDVSW